MKKDEMQEMEEYSENLLAEEVLKAHNMPTLFSYRYAFILGMKKAEELLKPMLTKVGTMRSEQEIKGRIEKWYQTSFSEFDATTVIVAMNELKWVLGNEYDVFIERARHKAFEEERAKEIAAYRAKELEAYEARRSG